MYLYRQQYANPKLKDTLKLEQAGKLTTITPERPTYLLEEIACWHKANHIHRWFVENVQGGRDDCRDYYVDDSHLKDLLATVIKVLNRSKLVPGKVSVGDRTLQPGKRQDIWEDGLVIDNPKTAQALLPRMRGCFFGLYGYDQFYVEDLRQTKTFLEDALNEPASVELVYSSSW